MELPPINHRLATKANPATPTNTPALAKLSNALSNHTLEAVVEKVTPLTEQQRQAIIKSLVTQNQQITTNAQTLKAETPFKTAAQTSASTLELVTTLNDKANAAQNLLTQLRKMPTLQMIRVSTAALSSTITTQAIKNTDALLLPRTLDLISPVTPHVDVGKKINLLIRSDGQLQLLATAPKQSQPLSLTASSSTNLNTHSPSGNQHPPLLLNKEQQNTLQHALKTTIPYEQPVARAINSIKILHTAINALPLSKKNHVISPAIQQKIGLLLNSNTLPPIATTADQIKNIIHNSGHRLETKLTAPFTTLTPPSTTPKSVAAAPLTTNAVTTPNTALDTKAQLLHIFSEATNEAAKINREPITATTEQRGHSLQQTLASAAAQMRGLEPLLASLNSLSGNDKITGTTQIDLRQKIARILAAASALGIAKISSHQIRQLLAANDSAVSAQQFDIALKIQDQVIPVSLQLTPHPFIDDDEKNAKTEAGEKPKTSKRWTIFMELELQEFGWLATEISLTGNKVSSRIWSEQDTIKSRVRKRLNHLRETLENNGLSVEEISIEMGNPPTVNHPISQSLIDIRT